jgi:NitT/TauT family transport system substrate-binding protein
MRRFRLSALVLTLFISAGLVLPAAIAVGQPMKPLKLGLSAWPGWFPWYIAEEQGFFTQEGASVELEWFPVYSDSITALSAGQLDANSQTLSDTLGPLAEGVPLSIVLVNDNSAGNDAIVAKPSIASVADLRGKTVATELGAVDHFMLLMALQRAGLAESDINFVNMAVNDAAPAFIAGQLDAVAVWQPFISQIQRTGGGKVLFDSRELPGLIPDLLVTRADVAQQQPDQVAAVVRAWYRSLDFIDKQPEQAYAIMARHAETDVAEYRDFAGGTRLFSVADNLEAFRPSDADVSLATAGKKIGDFLVAQNLIRSVPDLSGVLHPEFVQPLQAHQAQVE